MQNIAGAHADYKREDYIFPRTSSDPKPMRRERGVKVWRVIAPVLNLALRLTDPVLN